MRNILRILILTVFLVVQPAIAGLPPTRSGGQSDTLSTTFDFQAPLSQITKTSGTAGLIETGNYNLLKNPGFEGQNLVGWTVGGLTSVTTLNVGLGKKALSWYPIGAAETFTSDSITIPPAYYGQNGELTCAVKHAGSAVGGNIGLNASAGTIDQKIELSQASGTYQYFKINFVFPTSGTLNVLGTSGSPYGESFVDDCYLGLARNVAQCGVDTPLVPFTPVVTSLSGSLTNYTVTGFWKRNGDTSSYKFRILFNGSPGTWSTPQLSLPSGHVIDVNKIPGGSVSNYRPFQSSRLADASVGSYVGLSAAYTTTSVIVQYESAGQAVAVTQVAPFAFVSGDWIDVELSGVPIVGWEASQCVTPEQQRAPKITHYLSGSGTHTWSNGVTHATIEIIGGGGGGGGAGTSSTAGGAGGQSSFGGVNAPGGTGGGNGTGGGSGSPGAATAVPCTTNETYMCRGGARGAAGTVTDVSASSLHAPGGHGGQSRYGGAGLGLYESTGAAAQANTGSGGAGGAGDAATYYAGAGGTAGADITWHRVAPSGSASYTVGAAGAAGTGTRNGGAGGSGYIKVTEYFGYTTAILANSVSTSVTNGAKMIWASVKSTCSASPCTIGAQSGDFTSITRSGTGSYQANFNAGTFSGTPVCTCSTVGSLDGHCSAYSSSTSTSTVRTYTPAGASQDGYIEMMCIGPR